MYSYIWQVHNIANKSKVFVVLSRELKIECSYGSCWTCWCKKLHMYNNIFNVETLPTWPGRLFFKCLYNDLTEKKIWIFIHLVAKQTIVWNFNKICLRNKFWYIFLQKNKKGYTFGTWRACQVEICTLKTKISSKMFA